MGLWSDWRAARVRRQRVAVYLGNLLRDPSPAHVEWLTQAVGEQATAFRELQFARRALGLIVAERDALDDRTAADVAHQLAPIIAGESRQDAARGREWSERWRSYTAALAVRGSPEPPAARLARVLLAGAGMMEPSRQHHVRATQFVLETRAALNEQLRAVFGAASLPEDVKPSAIRP
jgi:hypothetical protein